jgi:hypothetical protein
MKRTESKMRGLRAWFAAATMVAMAADARAEIMPHYDLRGLALQSDAIAFATRTEVRRDGAYRTIETFRVTRAVAGPIRVGATITLDTSLYATSPACARPDADAALFLTRDRNGQWQLVLSGMRVSCGGVAYRFVQQRNPGGLEPVEQLAEPANAAANGPATVPWTALAPMIDRAIAAADVVRRYEAQPTSPTRDALLALLPPQPDRAAQMLDDYVYEPRSHDVVTERVARIFEARRDVSGALAAGARVSAASFEYRPNAPLSAQDLWSVIERASDPPEQRATAIRAVTTFTLLVPAMVDRLAPLLRDPDALVRHAAARALLLGRGGSSSEPNDGVRRRAVEGAIDQLMGRFVATEQDPTLRFWLYLQGTSKPSPLGRLAPRAAFFAHAQQRSAQIGVAERRTRGAPRVESVELELRAPGTATIACGAQVHRARWSTAGASMRDAALRCAGARDGQSYVARLRVRVADAGAPAVRVVDVPALRW